MSKLAKYIWTALRYIWEVLFINEQGKFSYTTVTSIFGMILTVKVVNEWEASKVVDPYFLEWSKWVILFSFGYRPAQKIGMSIIDKVSNATPWRPGKGFNDSYGEETMKRTQQTEDPSEVKDMVRQAPTPSTTQEKFVVKFYPYAKKSEKTTGIHPVFVLAQAALESGWGKSAIGNNLFGITANANYKGVKVLKKTTEYHKTDDVQYPKVHSITWDADRGLYKYSVDRYFRDYTSPEEGFIDHGRILQAKHFEHAWPYRGYPKKFAEQIQAGKLKYATSDRYVATLHKMINMVDGIVTKFRLS